MRPASGNLAAVGKWDVPAHVLSMPGYTALRSLERLTRVLRLLEGNAMDLARYFEDLNDPTNPVPLLELWAVDNRTAFDAHLGHAERLLFNVLAACQARVDFYRALVNRDLIEGDLQAEYQRRVRAVSSAPLHRWLIDLRRLMQHHDLPVSSGSMTVEADAPMRTTFMLDLEHLRRVHRDEFGAVGRRYMTGRDQQDVPEFVADYLSLVGAFDKWFGPAYALHHLEDIEAFLRERDAAGQAMWRERARRAREPEPYGHNADGA
jgi:hypothetical protein